jgi:O-acetylhomoserine/O-acetylserine sulfhydrylase-like pyridoxal-dependent enzyme
MEFNFCENEKGSLEAVIDTRLAIDKTTLNHIAAKILVSAQSKYIDPTGVSMCRWIAEQSEQDFVRLPAQRFDEFAELADGTITDTDTQLVRDVARQLLSVSQMRHVEANVPDTIPREFYM